MILNGKVHVSSKRAAEITGYAKDYIGQLCREGRIEARLVGRSWYAEEESLRKHRFGDIEGATEPVAAAEPEVPAAVISEELPPDEEEAAIINAIEEGEMPVQPQEEVAPAVEEDTWTPAVYTPEEVSVLPEMEKGEPAGDFSSEAAPVMEETPEIAPVQQEEAILRQEKQEIPAPVTIRRESSSVVNSRKTLHDIQPAPAHPSATPQKPHKAEKVSRKNGNVIGSRKIAIAALVAISIFSLSFSAIVSGFYVNENGPFSEVFQYLGGVSAIKGR